MRFATKFDFWLVILLILAAFFSLALPWILPHGGRYHHPAPLWIGCGAWLLWIVVLLSTLPQYYEMRPEGLFIRQGWRKSLLPYDSLLELNPHTDASSAGVYSLDRVEVVTRQRTFIIAPRNQDAFLDAVRQRAPQLQRQGIGLAARLR